MNKLINIMLVMLIVETILVERANCLQRKQKDSTEARHLVNISVAINLTFLVSVLSIFVINCLV